MRACAKSVVRLNAHMHQGHWGQATHPSLERGGRTVGLVGLGTIGQRFARRGHAMNLRVIGFDRDRPASITSITPVDLDTRWQPADALSLNGPSTPENRPLRNAQTQGRCRPGVIVANPGLACVWVLNGRAEPVEVWRGPSGIR